HAQQAEAFDLRSEEATARQKQILPNPPFTKEGARSTEEVTHMRSRRKPLTFGQKKQQQGKSKSSPTRPASRHSLPAFTRARTCGS
ncbi:hypothetical protein, partial [Lysobacter sp. cf310]|uniref:hypothetical protein n=1 Tax=Lysobacter sp. cf310 TaxID=1761790 RepID=UPI001C3126E6